MCTFLIGAVIGVGLARCLALDVIVHLAIESWRYTRWRRQRAGNFNGVKDQ